MAAPLRTYSPEKVSVIIGNRAIKGFFDGSAIEARRSEDSFRKHVGITGEVSRTRVADRSGEVILRLKQDAPDNDYLSGLLAVDEATGTGSTNLLIRDQDGTTLIESESCWIRKYADVTYGDDIEVREWTIDAVNLGMVVGGNAAN